jgi:LacI family transcriptional regulator
MIEGAPMAVALKDIASEAGVSVGTASDIINRGRASLYSDSTRRRVVEVSRKRNYHPHRAAQAMRANKTRVIGFATVNFSPSGMVDNYRLYPFIVGLNHRLSTNGYHVGQVELAELETSAAIEPYLPHALHERFFDALVVQYGLSDRAARFAESLGIPLVWWDSGVFDPFGCIYRDEQSVTREVMTHLMDLGHRHIAFMVGEGGWQRYLEGNPSHYSYVHRFETYRDIMQGQGLPAMPIVGYDPDACARQLRECNATAVLILGTHSIVLLEAAHRLQWRIGHELSVASLDLDSSTRDQFPGVGGMLYDRYDAGRQAAEMVLQTLADDGQPQPSVKIKNVFEPRQTIAPAEEHH